MLFEFYVLNYDHNKKCVYEYNIFNNVYVQEYAEKAVKKYLRSPSKFKFVDVFNNEEIYGFDAFCKEINGIIMWQEWSRYEYEISVGEPFAKNIDSLEKWDCYSQCKCNIPIIAREIIYQYKQQIKNERKV